MTTLSYCGSCGTPVAGDFCGSCGARSSQAGRPGVPIAPAAVPPPSPPSPTQPITPVTPVRSAPPPRRRSRWLVAATAAGVLLLASGGYAAAKLTILKDATGDSASTRSVTSVQPTPTSIPAPSETASPASSTSPVAVPDTLSPTPTPTPSAATPTADPAPAAYAELEALVGQDATRPTVRGQWVAQLSSKSKGVVDTTLQPTPFTVPDILAEHLSLRENPNFGSLVRLVHLGDWGGIATPASPMWVTVGDVNAGSSAEVTTWCETKFPQRGKALDNVCLARRLTLKSR